jgi:hypothetical protein
MRVAVMVTALLGAAVSACGPAPVPFKPVVDTKLLMQSVVDPNADLIWEAVKVIETSDGMQNIQPRTDAEWTAVRNAAITVTESGNLMMMPSHAKDGDWMKLAREMIAAGEAAIRAAEARNADKLFTTGGDLYESCTNCHRKYLVAIANANK